MHWSTRAVRQRKRVDSQGASCCAHRERAAHCPAACAATAHGGRRRFVSSSARRCCSSPLSLARSYAPPSLRRRAARVRHVCLAPPHRVIKARAVALVSACPHELHRPSLLLVPSMPWMYSPQPGQQALGVRARRRSLQRARRRARACCRRCRQLHHHHQQQRRRSRRHPVCLRAHAHACALWRGLFTRRACTNPPPIETLQILHTFLEAIVASKNRTPMTPDCGTLCRESDIDLHTSRDTFQRLQLLNQLNSHAM